MLGFIANRVIRSILVLFLISVVTFTFMQLTPGGPFSADAGGRPRSPEVQKRLEAEFGLDKPPVEQYLNYMGNLLFRFDFGPSTRQIDFTVNQLMFGVNFLENPWHAPVLVSAQIGLYSFLLAVVFGIIPSCWRWFLGSPWVCSPRYIETAGQITGPCCLPPWEYLSQTSCSD